MKKNLKLIYVLLLVFVTACSTDSITSSDEEILLEKKGDQTEVISGEYIIIFKKGADSKTSYFATKRGKTPELTRIQNFYKTKALEALKLIGKGEGNLGYVYTGAIQGFHAKDLSSDDVKILSSIESIDYIEPNRTVFSDLPQPKNPQGVKLPTGNDIIGKSDTVLPSGDFLPWGVDYTGRGNNAGTNRYVFVIDTGIAPHSDLTIDSGLSESFYPGEDWVDRNGHGTHVAGTIGAKANGSGVIGVAYGSTLVAVKVLGGTQGTGSDAGILAGVDYTYNNSIAGDVFNYSVGYRTRRTSTAIDNAFTTLDNKIYGALAAGNSNDNTLYYSPQRLQTSRTWMVGNLTRSITPNGSSCYGASVDRWAPGTDVWSTWLNGNYNRISGTSMASPHVAGILAVRGNNSVGTQGNTTKNGFTAPNAKK
ncbi:S8 family serine peptidase [Kordia algicida OT-1]|uniref:Peptidase S8 and S53, subtilisin, kexin, sedolisin n=1 Tax=Kordia algicida OT-1 TaxID=391587 RepID=A9ECM8_9FLAO|nr:S8 family serine peptidase [Kordia algicida]EDP94390.1 peptidase S8 and S53, subtilisin, kexin, sedolisin [Kordia algicida OT-1]